MTRPFGRESERAVSDVLAFVIVFSIIITSVALVYSTGFSGIQEIRDGEQKANAERAMEALGLSMSDIVKGQATRRGGSLNLGGGQLRTGDSTTVNVTVDGTTVTTDPATGNPGPRPVGSFEFYSEDTAVAYESGGVFRRDGSASVTVVQPTVTCDSEAAVVSLVAVTSSSGAIGATDNVEVSMAEQSTELLHTQTGSNIDVNVTVDGTDYAAAWERMLDDEEWDASRTGDRVSTTPGSCSPNRVVVRLVVIELTYGTP
jgi:hypothetical protein